MAEFKNRIVGLDQIGVDDILFHPDNWRIHPVRQQAAMKDVLSGLGWADTVKINVRSSEAWPPGDRGVKTLIDGHMRVMLAARNDEKYVPVLYVDLDPEEEALFLATHDPLSALAATDNEKLLELTGRLEEQHKSIVAALRGAGIDARKTFSHIETPAAPAAEGEQPKQPALPQPKMPEAKQIEQKYPLAIVLDRRAYESWQTVKAKLGAKTDTDALVMLISKVE